MQAKRGELVFSEIEKVKGEVRIERYKDKLLNCRLQ